MDEDIIDDLKKKIAQLEANLVQKQENEKVLQKSVDRYKELVEMLPETVYEMDLLTGNLTFVNKKSYERFGYTREDFEKGLNAFSMIIPEDWQKAHENISKIIRGEKGPNEYTALRKDGSTFKAKFYSSVIYDHGKPVGLRGFIIDITELKCPILRPHLNNPTVYSKNNYRHSG